MSIVGVCKECDCLVRDRYFDPNTRTHTALHYTGRDGESEVCGGKVVPMPPSPRGPVIGECQRCHVSVRARFVGVVEQRSEAAERQRLCDAKVADGMEMKQAYREMLAAEPSMLEKVRRGAYLYHYTHPLFFRGVDPSPEPRQRYLDWLEALQEASADSSRQGASTSP